MKRLLFILYGLFCSCIFSLLAEDAGMCRYQDSILKVAGELPPTVLRLTYLGDMAYTHQYVPYNMTFSARLYQEARNQKNVFYENLGAYYLATCYDRKHAPDSLSYWVNELKRYAPQVGTYDYYLEQKAAVSRALASKRQIEKAVHVAKETLAESKKYKSNNGMIAAYNSLGCAYSVSSRKDMALDVFLQAYKEFTPSTKACLKVDILSRIAQIYGNSGQDSLKLPYLQEMDTTLRAIIAKEPATKRNWTNFEIDCEVKYILHFMNHKDFDLARKHIEKVKRLLEPHVDPVFWLNVQLIQLQYYSRTCEYDKSIALIDEVTPYVLNNHVSVFATLINYKASTQYDKGDIDGAIKTRRYLVQTQDSLNNAFSISQLQQVKEIYHIDELLAEKQKIMDSNYKRGVIFLSVFLVLIIIFYLYTRYISKKIAASERLTAEATLRAEAENATKEHLKTEISHDIRIPLNAVVGFAELLTESKDLDNETKKEYSLIIQSNAEGLLNYINSILELSRLESGKIQYRREECELIGLCRHVLQNVNEKEGALVTATLETDVEVLLISIDCKWFELVLTGLIMPIENETEHNRVIVRLKRDIAKSEICFEVINSPLAKVRFENKTNLIRHEINAHFVHYFGGVYQVNSNTAESPATVIFTIPFTGQS